MERTDLEHIIRAAGSITQDKNTAGVTAWCLEIHDLIISKYVAGRERDLEFASEAIIQGLVQEKILRERVSMLHVEESVKDRIIKIIGK